MTTLDGNAQTFTDDDLLICDADDRPIGVGGVMGGLDTEITDATTTVVLEIAWFTSIGVMQTAARLGLRSEASAGSSAVSTRTGSTVPSHGSPNCCARRVPTSSCTRVPSTSGASPCRRSSGAPTCASPRSTGSSAPRSRPTTSRVSSIRSATPCPAMATRAAVALPSWRPDSEAEIDVVEEVARHYGYDRIGKTVPKSIVHGRLSATQQRRRQLRQVLLGLGISEAMPNPFLAPDTLAKAGLDSTALTITNPLVAEESVLRTSLRPGLL